ncbi:hypothetical protein H6G97_07045 [Nostoc flagelliforme FACHB-838]|uniref:Uncharacterized protein n=1 Tax=Nostoc flagelliforme FACHB-838 TaxID=2692904 RepID=A0ABR8DK21_9NOSO|nr:hypothetical protein [Nostoc flagelliforme]MBD2529338.1 hypothetical protein [Nostoc flagelliforme FACHB-838]
MQQGEIVDHLGGTDFYTDSLTPTEHLEKLGIAGLILGHHWMSDRLTTDYYHWQNLFSCG